MAFNKVPYQWLLLKLHCYSVYGQTHHWNDNFLYQKTQQVGWTGVINRLGDLWCSTRICHWPYPVSSLHQCSVQEHQVTGESVCGWHDLIPQNLIPKRHQHTPTLYHKIWSQGDTNILQEYLDQLKCWKENWQMTFNIDMCHVLMVSRKRK